MTHYNSRKHDYIEPYVYAPLEGENAIRLLKLLPSEGGEVVCELEQAEGSRSIRYEALSYCWGSGTPVKYLQILEKNDLRSVAVGMNLYQALEALRSAHDVRYLWIDAVCIDQNNLQERGQQVARMHEIYSEAWNVCIWLGPSNKDDEHALRFIASEALSIWNFEDKCRTAAFLDGWASILRLLTSPWFSRRWILQEVCLAQRATVHRGSDQIKWEDFSAAVSLLTNFPSVSGMLSQSARSLSSFAHADDIFDGAGALAGARLVRTVSELAKRSDDRQVFKALESLVDRLTMFQASDPRDVIYSLLALANDTHRPAAVTTRQAIEDAIEDAPRKAYHSSHRRPGPMAPAQARRLLNAVLRQLRSTYRESYPIDYDQQIVDVYQQFLAHVISRSDPVRALDVLCRPFAPDYTYRQDLNGNSSGSQDMDAIVPLPTWIPRLKQAPGNSYNVGSREHRFVRPPESPFYHSAAGTRGCDKRTVRFRKYHQSYSMFVVGFVLDTITEVDVVSQKGSIPKSWLHRERRLVNDDARNAFWQMLVASVGSQDSTTPAPVYKKIFETMVLADDAGKLVKHSVSWSASSGILADALTQIEVTISGRCLFRTERGLLGLGPGKMEMLQKEKARLCVCVLYGCSVPVILQHVQKTEKQIVEEWKQDVIRREDLIRLVLARWRKRRAPSHIRRARLILYRIQRILRGNYGANSALAVAVFVATVPQVGILLPFSLLVVLSAVYLAIDVVAYQKQAFPQVKANGFLVAGFLSAACYSCLLFAGHHQPLVMLNMGAIILIYLQAHHTCLGLPLKAALQAFDQVISYSRRQKGYIGFSVVIVSGFLALPLLSFLWWRRPFKREPLLDSHGALCDACRKTINGLRYECSSCPHARYCDQCVEIGRTDHSYHLLVARNPDENAYYYELVGECYVHNMMNGEAISLQNKDQIRSVTFELR